MNHNMNQSIIEITVNNTIKKIQNDPERSMRNIVDMALMFCNGRFQQKFLETAQKMLENENSSYYRIIPDLIKNVESTRITTLGINIGYHSCTKGARIIRKIEKTEKYNVPWCINLDLEEKTFHQNKETYFSLIEQGQLLGIHTWFVNSHSDLLPVLELAEHFSDSAFIIMCRPEDITEVVLDEFNEIYNILFAVNYADGIEDTCALLRKRLFPFATIYKYHENDIENILNDSILYDLSSLHAAFTLFCADSSTSVETQKQIYEYVYKMRSKQCFQTIPFDLIYDIYFIDEIISEDAVSIRFDADGICHSSLNTTRETEYSMFHHPLSDILKMLVPKE